MIEQLAGAVMVTVYAVGGIAYAVRGLKIKSRPEPRQGTVCIVRTDRAAHLVGASDAH